MENKISNYPIIIQADKNSIQVQRYKNFHMSGKRPHLLRKLDKCGLFIRYFDMKIDFHNFYSRL